MDAHPHEGAHVDGDGPVAARSGVHVGDAVGAEHGRVLVVEPPGALGRQAGESGVGVPRAQGLPPAVAADVDEDDVALLDGDARGFELVGGDGVAGLEPVDASDPGDVEQHAPADDAGVGCLDRAALGADAGHLGGWCAVVHTTVD